MPELEQEYGIKRICQSCAARYYDLNKETPVCPSCGTEYDPEAVMRSRRGRVAAAAVAGAVTVPCAAVIVGVDPAIPA